MGYASTLIVILIMVNIMLYFYGVDIPISTLLNFGAQEYEEGNNPGQPTGSTHGGLSSSSVLWTMLTIVGAAIFAGIVAGLSPSIFGSDTKVNFTIPMAMFMALALFIFSPMGNIMGTWTPENGMICYPMRSDVVMFNSAASTSCLPSQAHLLLVVFFGVLTIAAIMTFVSGRDW